MYYNGSLSAQIAKNLTFLQNYELITRGKELLDFIRIEVSSYLDASLQYAASINCPYCSKPISVSRSSSLIGSNVDISNFDSHLKDHHHTTISQTKLYCEY